MRYHKSMIAASLAVVAATAFAATASAEVVNGKEVLGAKPIVVDNFKYGGNLPVGADKNLDALKVLIKSADSMGQLRDNQYGGALYLVIGDTTNAMRINADGHLERPEVPCRPRLGLSRSRRPPRRNQP